MVGTRSSKLVTERGSRKLQTHIQGKGTLIISVIHTKVYVDFEENAVDGMMLLNDINADILKQDLGVKALHLKKFEREILSLKNKEEGEGEEGKTGAPQCHLVVNTFGFGAQHNNELLEKIASSFDGNKSCAVPFKPTLYSF